MVAVILVSLPRFIKSVRKGQATSSLTGVWENGCKSYEPAPSVRTDEKNVKHRRTTVDKFSGLFSAVCSVSLWTIPGVGLDVGQGASPPLTHIMSELLNMISVILTIAYFITLLLCITLQAELIDNPNRAGFMAVAQLPVVFLFATKNSPLSLLLGAGRGWEKLNFFHRWAGRGMFISAAIHGSLWIRSYLHYNVRIFGSRKKISGIVCLALLALITFCSLRPVRAFTYQAFFFVQ